MEKSSRPPYTSELYALRQNDKGHDESVVLWAESMILSGFSGTYLNILLGEIAPYNKFEIDDLLDRVQHELSIPEITSEIESVIAITTAKVRRYLQGWTDSTRAMYEIAQLCISHGHLECIYDFFLLHYASVDLKTVDIQYYWPDANAGNIEKIIFARCVEWCREHPLTKWQKYEWHIASLEN